MSDSNGLKLQIDTSQVSLLPIMDTKPVLPIMLMPSHCCATGTPRTPYTNLNNVLSDYHIGSSISVIWVLLKLKTE